MRPDEAAGLMALGLILIAAIGLGCLIGFLLTVIR